MIDQSLASQSTNMLQEHLLKVKAFRNKSGSLPSGIAPAVHSDQFRIHKNSTTLKAKRWDQRLSLEGKARNKSTLKASASPPDMISLGIARPALQYSPVRVPMNKTLHKLETAADGFALGFSGSQWRSRRLTLAVLLETNYRNLPCR